MRDLAGNALLNITAEAVAQDVGCLEAAASSRAWPAAGARAAATGRRGDHADSVRRVSVDFARCIPVLASLDIAETRDFYVGQLGFTGSTYRRGRLFHRQA